MSFVTWVPRMKTFSVYLTELYCIYSIAKLTNGLCTLILVSVNPTQNSLLFFGFCVDRHSGCEFPRSFFVSILLLILLKDWYWIITCDLTSSVKYDKLLFQRCRYPRLIAYTTDKIWRIAYRKGLIDNIPHREMYNYTFLYSIHLNRNK